MTFFDPARYAELFRVESREQLAAINEALLSVEDAAGAATAVGVVFRAVHTIKGMSATMGYQALAAFTHDVESVLDRLRRGERTLSPEMLDALFATVDALEQGVASASEEAPAAPGMTTALLALQAVTDAESLVPPAMAPLASAEPIAASPASPSPAADIPVAVSAESPIAASVTPAHVPRGIQYIRMDAARLDTLMNLIGELVITRGRLLQLTAGYGDAALDEAMQQGARLIADLQTEIVTSRLVPAGQVFDRFPRLVRDAARQLHKDVAFTLEGRDIECDRALLDEIGEPVVHLLRNAVDHGIESPADREAAGKPRTGQLVLSAVRDRAAVFIHVRDDGRGIDRARVLEKAKALGLVDAGVSALDDEQLFRCIAQPGFSTASAVSDLSGRGVGVDAVQAKVRALGGSVELRTTPGVGTTVTLRLPVTLAIVRALLAQSGRERYALPLTHVRETLAYGVDVVQHIKGRPVLVLRDEVLPLLDLRDVMQQDPESDPVSDALREIVVIERGDRRSGLVVDTLIGHQDIVVKPFDAARDGLALFSGATILADGAPALIVDIGSLFQGT